MAETRAWLNKTANVITNEQPVVGPSFWTDLIERGSERAEDAEELRLVMRLHLTQEDTGFFHDLRALAARWRKEAGR